MEHWILEGTCQEKSVPCNGICSAGSNLCDDGKVCVTPEDESYYTCAGACVHISHQCNGQCPENTWQCGEECVLLTNDTVVTCGDMCQVISDDQASDHWWWQDIMLPCQGSCAPGYTLCDEMCLMDVGDVWSCGNECYPVTRPCNDTCYPGRVPLSQYQDALVSGIINELENLFPRSETEESCLDPSLICPDNQQCVSDSDCQAGMS